VPPDTLLDAELQPEPPRAEAPTAPRQSVLRPWLRAQSINVTRHAAALRPFRREEFGTGAAAPSEGHIQAVNSLIGSLRRTLLKVTGHVTSATANAAQEPTSERLQAALERKDSAHRLVQATERVWDFYLELFGQR
jgi:hypothetical protein